MEKVDGIEIGPGEYFDNPEGNCGGGPVVDDPLSGGMGEGDSRGTSFSKHVEYCLSCLLNLSGVGGCHSNSELEEGYCFPRYSFSRDLGGTYE